MVNQNPYTQKRFTETNEKEMSRYTPFFLHDERFLNPVTKGSRATAKYVLPNITKSTLQAYTLFPLRREVCIKKKKAVIKNAY